MAAVASVYLVQDSGWMEPFYTDPASSFRPLVKALIAASDAGGETVVASFDQDGQVPGRRSPNVVYRGADDPAAIARAVDSIEPARQRDGHLADADFDGALVGGVQTILDGQPGIVWMITNNRNSPGNSQRVTENTRDFATRLGSSAALPAIVSYPVRMPVRGKLYEANGLIIYGIAYGNAAATELERITHAPALTRLFSDPAVQLKPLDQARLSFLPERSATPGLHVSRGPQGGLVFDGVPGGTPSVVSIEGALRSDFYPHVIDRARLSLGWVPPEGGGPALEATIAPDQLTALQPEQAENGVTLSLHVPAIDRAPGIAGWLQKDVVLHGTLRIALSGVGLSLSDGFQQKMAQIAAMDQLPSVFFADRSVSAATTDLPVTLIVRFSAWPLILGLGGIAAALVLLLALLALLLAPRQHAVTLAGQVRRIRLRPFERREITLPGGRTFTVRGRLFGRPGIVERSGDTAR
ncbi:hypothetical protein NFI95_13360 [Acetobacteraceae bacterium KSS8]|uniref:Uncharacterized protein n=1 Tax=Endosaccharibacter trunci TaxID=2812733 RepID=A0ABT1W9J9_9PROT|nr:hypothetical protein [Acetobacteraceae bacterium KSS8]